MTAEGPLLEALTRRLAETPPDFLLEPRVGDKGTVHVDAVVADVLRDLGGAPLADKAAASLTGQKQPRSVKAHYRNWLRQVLVASWLVADPWFREAKGLAGKAETFLCKGLQKLARLVAADLLVSDADRREELVRLALDALGFRPQGESANVAADRLKTLSSEERERVIRESKAQQERARKLREAMARKEAEEAAARYSRE